MRSRSQPSRRPSLPPVRARLSAAGLPSLAPTTGTPPVQRCSIIANKYSADASVCQNDSQSESMGKWVKAVMGGSIEAIIIDNPPDR